nr:hypothetical protein CFP56_75593 [Quercus suber]
MGTVGVLLAYTARNTLFACCIAGIVVTTLTTAIRVYVRFKNQQGLFADDYAILVALALYISLAGLYIADIPSMFGFLDFTSGKTPFSVTVEEDFHQMMMYNFAVTPLYWAVLWAVKISLLLFFRRIVERTKWMRVWWSILVVTVLAFAGCLITQFLSCDSIADFTVLADVVTDVAIMALPLRVVFGLQMTTRDKLSIAALFSTNIIAIVVSMIRVFLIWAKTGSASPSPAWLALWAVNECMMFRQSSNRRSSGPVGGYTDGVFVKTGSTSQRVSNLRSRPEMSSSKEHLRPALQNSGKTRINYGSGHRERTGSTRSRQLSASSVRDARLQHGPNILGVSRCIPKLNYDMPHNVHLVHATFHIVSHSWPRFRRHDRVSEPQSESTDLTNNKMTSMTIDHSGYRQMNDNRSSVVKSMPPVMRSPGGTVGQVTNEHA